MHKETSGQNRSASKSVRSKKLEELVLPNSKLKFCAEQLQNLNFLFNKKLQRNEDVSSEKASLLARSVTERLIQRLLCGVGILDPRFSSKFLVVLDHDKNPNAAIQHLKYLVRLDALSSPPLYKSDKVPRYFVIERDPEYPPGYARIRLHSSTYRIWGEYANAAAYLRRDKIQARLVELLAQAASNEAPNSPLQIDDSWLCGSPGKIVDSVSLLEILKVPPENHVFYGAGGNIPRFPDPRDFRLAIVDEPSGIRVRVEFLSPALSSISMEVRLLVAIGLDSWPASSNFPARVPLGHTDCLLYHKAAQTGMYLVGFGVQSSAWQMRVPAAEDVLLNNYGPNSTVITILDILNDVLHEINAYRAYKKHQISYPILNEYILKTALFYEMENDTSNASTILINWSPLYLSTHVLQILDKLILALRDQKYPNYFFPQSNLLVNPGHLCEDDFAMEANKIKAQLLKYFDESLMSTRGNEDFKKMTVSQDTEMLLLNKWKELVDGLLPPSGTRGRRFCFAGAKSKNVAYSQYTLRQLEYISLVLKNMLKVKQNVLQQQSDESQWEENMASHENLSENHLEDVIYLLVSIMEQARDQYLENPPQNSSAARNKGKLKTLFDFSSTKVVEAVRRDKEIDSLDFLDDMILVKTILKWLYKALDQNKRYLAPILKPYLNTIFVTSHVISWHLEAIKKGENRDELHSLGIFAKLVNAGKLSPAEGLIDAVNKKWNWAKSMLDQLERGSLRVVFVPERGKVFRHFLSLPENRKRDVGEGSKTLEHAKTEHAIKKQMTLPSRNYFNTILKKDGKNDDASKPQHDILKEKSPMTSILNQSYRKGDHRCCGDLFQALLSMQKLSLVQEVSAHLPNEERLEILDAIHKITNERSKKSAARIWSKTLPQLSTNRHNAKSNNGEIQRYTPKEESAGIRIKKNDSDKKNKKEEILMKQLDKGQAQDSLIGSCRAARIREDNSVLNFQDNFKIKSLMRAKESFRS